MISNLRIALERIKGQKSKLDTDLSTAQSQVDRYSHELEITEKVRVFIQHCAKLTQDELSYEITDIGSMALDAIFPNSPTLTLQFKEERGKTSASFKFQDKSGNECDPLEEGSGGQCDISALGLRPALLVAQKPQRRLVIVMDEPFKNLNDDSREMHIKAAEMIAQMSKELGIQFLIVTMVPELIDIGTKIELGSINSPQPSAS